MTRQPPPHTPPLLHTHRWSALPKLLATSADSATAVRGGQRCGGSSLSASWMRYVITTREVRRLNCSTASPALWWYCPWHGIPAAPQHSPHAMERQVHDNLQLHLCTAILGWCFRRHVLSGSQTCQSSVMMEDSGMGLAHHPNSRSSGSNDLPKLHRRHLRPAGFSESRGVFPCAHRVLVSTAGCSSICSGQA